MATLTLPTNADRGATGDGTDRTRRPARRRAFGAHTFLILLVLYFTLPALAGWVAP